MHETELFDRWISLLRRKAIDEHNKRKEGKMVISPDLDDICNEMEAFRTGRISAMADYFRENECNCPECQYENGDEPDMSTN